MSVDYKTEIQSENEYLNNLEISVDTMHRNGVDYRTQLLDALDTISAMELEISNLKQRLKLLNEKYVNVLSDLWNNK
jgi:predicted  nucleic acid-binding Zn-ribbon protein|tara:strand:+ start:588 stop:818 length:231 start_codon:yes stop_codon:yes gene_type:complete